MGRRPGLRGPIRNPTGGGASPLVSGSEIPEPGLPTRAEGVRLRV